MALLGRDEPGDGGSRGESFSPRSEAPKAPDLRHGGGSEAAGLGSTGRRHALRSRYAQVALLAAAAVAVQLATSLAGREYLLTQLTMTAYYTVVALGLSLLMGYAGQISLGHAAFFAIGGYTSSVLTTLDLGALRGSPVVAALARARVLASRPDLYGGELLTVHPWPALAAAVTLASAVAFVIGLPALRLRGHYLAMATLGFGAIVSSLLVGTARLGAADGISGVPSLPLAAGVVVTGRGAVRVANYYVAWGLVAVAMLLLLNLVRSRVGRALRAIHGAEDAASAMGVDVARCKLGTFVLSAALAAVGGAFLAHYNGGIGPGEASAMKSIRYVAVVAVGGMGNLWGTLATSAVLGFLSLRGVFGTLDDAVFGAILIGVMMLARRSALRAQIAALVRRAAPSLSDARGEGS